MSNASGSTLIGPVMLDVAGQELTAEDRELIAHPLVGGVLLFTRNYRDHEQLQRLCDDILAVKKNRPLLAVDHEGGRVQRFRVGFSRVPAMRTLGKLHEESPSKALEEARRYGELIGQELSGFGFDLHPPPSEEAVALSDGVEGVRGVWLLQEQGDDGAGVEKKVHGRRYYQSRCWRVSSTVSKSVRPSPAIVGVGRRRGSGWREGTARGETRVSPTVRKAASSWRVSRLRAAFTGASLVRVR